MEEQFSLFSIFFTFLLFFFMALIMWKRSKINCSTPNLPPGPWRLPIIGNMHQLFCLLPHQRLRDLAKKYGPLMLLQLGEVSNIVISSPEVAKEVMKTHDIIFADRPFHLAASIIAYNARDIGFSPYGDYWRQLRMICTSELLSAKRVQSYGSIREEEVSCLIGSLTSNAGLPVNLSRTLLSLSNCITSRAAFGQQHDLQNAFVPLVWKIFEALGGFRIADFFPSIKLVQVITGVTRKFKRLHEEADLILENIISEHRTRKATSKPGIKGEAYDIVDVLLNLQDNGNLGFSLTTENIKAVILDMFLGGLETSTSVLEWAMSELKKNPRVMERAQSEVRQVFNPKEKVEEASLHLLKYLNLVVKETLRLHPPASLLIPREAREDVEINGYKIPAKTRVMVNAWAIGRDSRYWTEAERFHPERFQDSSLDYKGRDFEFIPFGAGRRICPGMLFAVTIVELSLANLLYHFDWKLPNGMKPENLDMTEAFGAAAKRKNDLHLIPIPYIPS